MHIEINIIPTIGDGANLLIDDFTDRGPRAYYMEPDKLSSLQDVRILLASESDFIYNTVVGMLKEMAT